MILSTILAQITYSVTNNGETSSGSVNGGVLAAILAGSFLVILLHIIGFWKTLTKGGEPGAMSLLFIVTCLAPIAFLPMMKLTGRPSWWVILLYIPIVNIVVLAIVSIDIAKSYGRSAAFGIGLWLLAPIFYLILGFGSSTYRGPAVRAA